MNFWRALQHGLSLDALPVATQDKQFIDEVISQSRKHHLDLPLLIFLEGLRPVSFIAASVLTGLEPFAELFFPQAAYQKFTSFVENRANLDTLIESLKQ